MKDEMSRVPLKVADKDQVRDSLLWAARNGQEADVQLLLGNKASLEVKDEIYGMTPLLWAALSGHDATVRLLREEGAVLGARDIRGETSLF
ncbi:hypothetical protein QBC43DRAFT_361430 [Cladorrhinum sp. PSN259]|nr:hypothetical protein QBC43DRAFT_361430 [Cladorrhinum sp. PSN259]